MENFEEALKEAIKSKDPNLIYEVIFKMLKMELDMKILYDLIGKFPFAKSYLITYLRNFGSDLLDDYFLHPIHTNEDKGLYFIQKAYQVKELPKRLTLVKDVALKHLAKERYYEDVTKEHIDLLIKMISDNKVKVIEEKSAKQYIELYLNLDDVGEAEKLKKAFKLSDKSFVISRLKVLAEQGKWTEFENVVADKNKKSAVVPYYAIVEMLVDFKQTGIVDKYVLKMPDIEDQIMSFKMMGKTKGVVDVAFSCKRYKLVDEIEANPNLDPVIKKYIDECYAKLKKK